MKALLRLAWGAALLWGLIFLSAVPGRAQNVGIGTTAPTQTLDVNGSLRVRAAAGTGTGRLLGVEADGTLKVQPPLFEATATPAPQAPTLGSAAATDGEVQKVLLNPAGTRAYVLTYVSLTNTGGQKRSSLQTFDVSGPTPVPVGSPVLTVMGGKDMALNQAGTRAWVLGHYEGYDTGFMQGFDLSQGQPVALGAEVAVGFAAQAIAVNPAGTRAFVSHIYGGELLTFDLSQGGTPVRLNELPSVWIVDMAVNPAGTRLFAVDGQDLTTYDLSSGLPVAMGSPLTTGTSPQEIMVSPDGARMYVLGMGQLLTYDISSGQPVAVGGPVSSGGSYPYGLTGSANGAVLAFQNFVGGTALRLYDVDGSGLPVARPAATGIGGGNMALSPDGSRAYLAYGGSTLRTVLLAAPRPLAVGSDGSLGSLDPALFKDNLGDHIASQNLNLGRYQLVGNGGSKGLSITAAGNTDLGAGQLVGNGGSTGLSINRDGRVSIGAGGPYALLDVQGGTRLSSAAVGTATQLRLTRPGVDGDKWPSSAELAVGTYAAGEASMSRLDFRLGLNRNSTSDQTVLTLRGDGRLGAGTTEPASQLANTNQNIVGSDNVGVSVPSLTWSSSDQGYAGAFYNGSNISYGGGGLAVKVASMAPGTAALDVSQGTGVSTAGTTLLRVRADGSVGIGTGAPSARLDVAGTVRLRGLTTAGIVTTDASGNLSSAAASSLADNLGNHAATQNLSLGTYQLVGNGGNTGLSINSVGNVGIGTTAPSARLDVVGNAQVSGNGSVGGALSVTGASTLTGKVTTTGVTSPANAGANLLAAGYGNVYGVGTLYNGSGNVTVAHAAGSGEYVLTFTGPLASADLGNHAVSLTLYNGPGFVSFVSGGAAGKLLVRTYNTSGTLTDRGFSFVVFQP